MPDLRVLMSSGLGFHCSEPMAVRSCSAETSVVEVPV